MSKASTNQLSHDQFRTAIELNKSSSKDLLAIVKEMSQLIAKSWLPGKEGEEIRKILLLNDSDEIKKLLKQEGIYDKVFDATFFEVNWGSFVGYVMDTTHFDQPSMRFVWSIAYPPKPDEFNLSDADLKEWVKNDNPKQEYPTHPYIPVTF